MSSSREHIEQVAVVQYCRFRALSDKRYQPIIAIPNGGKRTALSAIRLVREGLSPGFPDLALFTPNAKAHGLFIEMKIAPNRLSEHQRHWLEMLTTSGYLATVCWSAKMAQDLIDTYIADGDTAQIIANADTYKAATAPARPLA